MNVFHTRPCISTSKLRVELAVKAMIACAGNHLTKEFSECLLSTSFSLVLVCTI